LASCLCVRRNSRRASIKIARNALYARDRRDSIGGSSEGDAGVLSHESRAPVFDSAQEFASRGLRDCMSGGDLCLRLSSGIFRRQQLFDPVDRMISDVRYQVMQIGLRIEAIKFAEPMSE
jgi:hypothetical protein